MGYPLHGPIKACAFLMMFMMAAKRNKEDQSKCTAYVVDFKYVTLSLRYTSVLNFNYNFSSIKEKAKSPIKGNHY